MFSVLLYATDYRSSSGGNLWNLWDTSLLSCQAKIELLFQLDCIISKILNLGLIVNEYTIQFICWMLELNKIKLLV